MRSSQDCFPIKVYTLFDRQSFPNFIQKIEASRLFYVFKIENL